MAAYSAYVCCACELAEFLETPTACEVILVHKLVPAHLWLTSLKLYTDNTFPATPCCLRWKFNRAFPHPSHSLQSGFIAYLQHYGSPRTRCVATSKRTLFGIPPTLMPARA